MNRENFFVGILAAGCLVATFMLTPGVGHTGTRFVFDA